MKKKCVSIVVIIAVVVSIIYGCNEPVQKTAMYKKNESSENELPMVEYIDENILQESLWTSISQFHNGNIYNNKQDVIVALIDVGISEYYINSSYLYTNYNEIVANNIDDDGNGYVDDINGWNVIDNNGDVINYNDNSIHGTALLGMLIGENDEYGYYGMLTKRNVKIAVIKSLDDNTISGSVENIIESVKYAETIGADIVMMSFSTYVITKELEEVINCSDMLFIVAAGNEGKELSETYKVYPACYESDNIITVAALSNDGNIDFCSNYGKQYVDIAAPGENIVSYLGDNRFVFEGGTSFAVPYVVAEAAIILCSSEKKLSSIEIKNTILENVYQSELLEEQVSSGGVLKVDNILCYCK